MLSALLLGISYGFTAGISPGPTTGLVVAQSLQRGWRAGSLVALAPLLTDLPLILVTVFLVRSLPPLAFGLLGCAGGLFVAYLGVETLRDARRWDGDAALAGGAPGAVLWRAMLTNWLNPHPYLFWGAAGAQLLARSYDAGGMGAALAFLAGFYGLLVGCKLLLALLSHGGRGWLRGDGYRWVLVASGALLIGLGALLAWDGLRGLVLALQVE